MLLEVLYSMILFSRAFQRFAEPNTTPFCFHCRYAIVVWISGGSDDGKDQLTLLDDDDDMSPDDEAIGMVVPDGFRLQEARPAALDSSLVKRGVLVRLSMGWFGGLITRHSQERTKHVYDYRMHLVEDQSVRSMKLPLDAYSTGPNVGVGAWFCWSQTTKSRRGMRSEGARNVSS